jgi:hypothetical protein
MGNARRPPLVAVVLAAACAIGVVVSFATGHLNGQWVGWLALFLVMELFAVVKDTNGTFSERFWVWFGVRPPRPSRWHRVVFAVLFVIELGAHFALGDHYALTSGWAVAGSAAPLGIVIGYALVRES